MAPDRRTLTDEEILAQIPAAEERGRRADEHEPRARNVRYDERSGWTFVELVNGCLFAFPPDLEELRDLTPRQRAGVRLHADGRLLTWKTSEADLYLPLLLGGEYREPDEIGVVLTEPWRQRRSA